MPTQYLQLNVNTVESALVKRDLMRVNRSDLYQAVRSDSADAKCRIM